jgi:hypothetical protein
MEDATTIEKLIERAEKYSKTSLELYKHEAIFKATNIVGNLAVKIAISIVIAMFFLFVNLGLAIFIGQQLGQLSYGFFIVSLIYLIFAVLIYIFRESCIKNPLGNLIISEMKNENIL